MNEEALQQLYSLAQNEGYKKSIEDFKILMSSNEGALSNMYNVAQNEGYNKPIEDFKVLVGFGGTSTQETDPPVKKKGGMVSSSADGSSEPQESDAEAQDLQSFLTQQLEETPTQEVQPKFYEGVEAPSEAQVEAAAKADEPLPIGTMEDLDESLATAEWNKPTREKAFEYLSEEEGESLLDSQNPYPINTEAYAKFEINKFKEDPLKERPSIDEALENKFAYNLENIKPDLFEREEGDVVPMMEGIFKQYGFNFKATDKFGDGMIVSKEGVEPLYINLDMITLAGANLPAKKREADKLKKYLEENRDVFKPEDKDKEKLILASDKIKDYYVESFQNETQSFIESRNKFIELRNKSIDEAKVFEEFSLEEINADPILDEQFKSYIANVADIESQKEELIKKQKNIEEIGPQLDAVVGNYVTLRSKEGYLFPAMGNKFLRGLGKIAAGLSGKIQDAAIYVMPRSGLSEDKYKSEIIRISKEKGIELPENPDSLSLEELTTFLGGDTDDLKLFLEGVYKAVVPKGRKVDKYGNVMLAPEEVERTNFDLINDEILDTQRKGIKYFDSYDDAVKGRVRSKYSTAADYADVGKGTLNLIRESIVDAIGFKETTKQWAETDRGSFVSALLGLSESGPAIAAAIYGGPLGRLSLVSQAMDGLSEEMQNDPNFADISESEKMFIELPYGLVADKLERMGLSNLFKGGGMINKLVSKVVGKSTSKTTSKGFSDLVETEINSALAKGLIRVGAAGAAEFETGFLQEVASIGIRDIYNDIKGKKMFENPDTFVDGIMQSIEAGLEEAIGGGILGAPRAVKSAMSDRTIMRSDDFNEFQLFEGREDLKSIYVTKLKAKVASGLMTKKGAEAELSALNEGIGILKSNKDFFKGDASEESKSEAFTLLNRKKQLEQEIEGADPKLATPQIEELANINERLVELSKTKEDAIQEQSTETVDAQEPAESRPTMGETVPGTGTITEPTEVEADKAEQQVEEEATTEQEVEADEQAVEDFKSTIPDATKSETKTEQQQEEKADIVETFFESEPSESVNKVSGNLSINRIGEDTQKKSRFRNRVTAVAVKAAKSISKIIPETKIILHESNDEYLKYAKAGEGRAEYNPVQDIIHVNLSNATISTLPHEVFHAVLLNKVKTDEAAQKIAKKMVDSVRKTLPDNNELAIAIDKFAALYTGKQEQFQDEERISELIGLLASKEFGYSTLSKPAKNSIIEFFKNLANRFGIKLGTDFGKTDESVIDLINTIAKKTVEGEVIEASEIRAIEELNQEQGEEGGRYMKNPSSVLSRKQVGDFEVSYTEQENINSYLKDGRLKQPDDISFLEDFFTTVTSPDDMLAGQIKYKNKVIFEGEGGVFFVTMFGDVWASGKKGTANTIANSLNEQLKQNGGRAFLTLTKGTDSKLVSSASGVNSTLAVLNTMLDEGLISPSVFRAAVSKSVKKAKGSIDLRQSSKDLKIDIKKYFTNPKTSTFEKRGFIVKDIVADIAKNIDKSKQKEIAKLLGGDVSKNVGVGNTPKGVKGPGSQSLVDLIAKVAAEKLTKGLSVGDVYAVIEVNSEVEVKEDSHPSYPFHISLKDGSIPILHLPKNRKSGSKALVQKGSDGNYNLDYAVRNVSVVQAQYNNEAANKAVVEGEKRRAEKKSTPQSRKQIIGESAELSENVSDNYMVANQMEKANKSSTDIRVATGWERGADGKWRYEIDDVKIKEGFRARDLKEVANSPTAKFVGFLSDVIKNKKLFDSYPPLADIPVYFNYTGTGYSFGSYNPIYESITINIQPGNSTNEQMSTVLLHETQHYIQEREGFAKGGNTKIFENEMDKLSFGNVNALRSFAKDVARKNPEKGWDITYGSDAAKKYEEFFGEKPSPIVVTLASVLEQQLSRGVDINKTTVYKTLKNNNLTSFEKYERLAGEVEARNVQKRIDMTPEQRRNTLLESTEDVAREDQIFLKDQGIATRQSRQQRTEKLAPNGKQSNLTNVQYDTVRTPAFKKWFGNWETDPENSSKVVDENGEPMPQYHFTNAYFDVFKYKESGFHFGDPSIKEDLEIAKGEQFEREINVFLNIKNPLRVDDSHRFDPSILIQQLLDNNIINDEQFETLENLFYDIEENLTEDEYYDSNALVTKQSDALISVLENEGYDGLVYENAFDSQDSKMSYIIDEQSSKIYVRNNGNVFVGDVVLQSESESRPFITFSSNQGNVYVIENNEGTELTSQDNNRIKELLDAGGFVSTVNSSKTHSDFDLFTGEQKFTDSYVTFESNQSKLADGTNTTFKPESPSIRQQRQLSEESELMTSLNSIVEMGREQGIPDDSLKIILKEKGFKDSDINKALKVDIDLFTAMPKEFGNVEGGVEVGLKLFNETTEKTNKFSTEGPRGGVGTTRTKSFAEIREKAQEILKSNPIYKVQPEQVQLELQVALDRVLGIKKGPNVSRQIADIRNTLKQRKIGADTITDAQRSLRMFIRKVMPKSKNYSNTALNKLIKAVNNTTPKNFDGQVQVVLNQLEKQRQVLKNEVIDKIIKIARDKSKTARTSANRKRSKGLDAIGQSYFKEAKRVLGLVKNQDFEGLAAMQAEINEELITAALDNIEEGKTLTAKERALIDKQIALDTFADVMTMSLEEVNQLFEEVKTIRAESIARLNNRREARRIAVNEIKEKFNEQISEDFEELYNEEGEQLGKNILRNKREGIYKSFQAKGIWNKVIAFTDEFRENGKFRKSGKYDANGIIKFFRGSLQHLGTTTNILDRGKEGMFTKIFYNQLNDMDEKNLAGVFEQLDVMDSISNSEAGKVWGKWKYTLGTDVLILDGIKESKTGKTYREGLNRDQAMRLYALSLNPVQREKLQKQGFTEEKMKLIEDFIKPEGIGIANQIVDYFSNKYFNEVNNIYVQANDVNLGYVENYFPTRTISAQKKAADMISGDFSKVFTADTSPALQERTDTKGDVEIGMSFTDVVEQHIKDMERYKAYALGVKQMNEVYKSPDIQTLLQETGLFSIFNQNLNYAINPDAGPKTTSGVLSWIQRKFTGFALAFKPIQVLKQATSFVQAYEDYSFVKGKPIPGFDMVMFALDYAKVLATLPKQIKESKEISATFKNRMKMGMEGDVFGLESGGRTYKKIGSQQGRRGAAVRGFKKAAGIFTVMGDILGVLGYKAVYNRNIANGMSKAEALSAFNNYNATQQTRRSTEKVSLQQDNSFASKYFTMFGSTLFLQMNKTFQSANNIVKNFKPTKGEFGSLKDYRALALNVSVANALFTAAAYSGVLLKGDDEDKDRAWQAIKDAALGLNILYQIPLAGTAIEEAVSKARGKRAFTSEGVNPFTSVSRKVQKSYKLLKDDEVIKAVKPIIELSIGAQFDSPIGIYNLIGGSGEDEDFYDALGITPSYRPGYGKRKSKKKSSKSQSKLKKSEVKEFFPDLYKELYEND